MAVDGGEMVLEKNGRPGEGEKPDMEETKAQHSEMNKRRLKRRQLIYYLKVQDRMTGKPLGRLVDVTTEGMMLVSTSPIDLNVNYFLRMDLPTQMEKSSDIRFEAKSLWRKKDINPDFYDTGFKFTSIAPEFVEMIGKMIDEYELPG